MLANAVYSSSSVTVSVPLVFLSTRIYHWESEMSDNAGRGSDGRN
jgi:hypothetical protein